MAGRAQRRDVVRAQVLHLVDEQGDAGAYVGGQVRDLGEQLDEIDLDVAGVGAAGGHGHVDAGLPAVAQLGSLGRGAQRERLEHAEDLLDPAGRAVADGDVADRPVQRGRQRAAQVRLGPGLDLAGAPAGADGHRAQFPQEHRLADAAQPGQDEAAFGTAPGDALEHDLERVQLAVPPRELGRPLAGAGGERVAHRVHARTVSAILARTVDPAIERDGVSAIGVYSALSGML
jgi:hypothetical protein